MKTEIQNFLTEEYPDRKTLRVQHFVLQNGQLRCTIVEHEHKVFAEIVSPTPQDAAITENWMQLEASLIKQIETMGVGTPVHL